MQTQISLDVIEIKSPCPMVWDEMMGDGRVRHCSKCDQKVYDLSAMTRVEAETLVAGREGRLCVRFYRRMDGKVMTADCPHKILRAAAFATKQAFAAVVVVLFVMAASPWMVWGWITSKESDSGGSTPLHRITNVEPIRTVKNWLFPPPMITGKVVMGDIAGPPPQQFMGRVTQQTQPPHSTTTNPQP